MVCQSQAWPSRRGSYRFGGKLDSLLDNDLALLALLFERLGVLGSTFDVL